MPNPSLIEIARMWQREGRVFPLFGPEVDERRVRWIEAYCTRDDTLGGYVLHPPMVQRALTDVAYLGWRVRLGALALDEDGQPRMCHEPLVDTDLFWWCFDALLPTRPHGAPPRPTITRPLIGGYRPRRRHTDVSDEPLFVAPGRIRCAIHRTRYAPVRRSTSRTQLQCSSPAREVGDQDSDCPKVVASSVEEVLCSAFVDVLSLGARDIENKARVADEQASLGGHTLVQLRQEMEDQRTLYDRAKRSALLVDDDQVAAEMLAEAARIFHADWNHTSYQPDTSHLLVSPVNARAGILGIITGARKTLHIEDEEMYDRASEDALIAAARHGVDVELVLPTSDTDDPNSQGHDVPCLIAGGVHVHYLGAPYVHAKLILADGTLAVVGSQNFSATSLEKHRKVGVVIADAAAIQTLTSTFERD